MKKLFIILVIFLPAVSCKTTRVNTSATDTAGKMVADTALQGDRMKNPVRQ